MYKELSYSIKEVLRGNCIAIHHIGSTAVPGLAAKPKIDIIALVKELKSVIAPLKPLGYLYRGEFNIPFHYCFTKREGVRSNLHIFEEGHPEIELNLTFRDYLREHEEARAEYSQLKRDLLESDGVHEKRGSMFTGYTLGKDRFITKVLKKCNFNRVRFLKCTHLEEIEAAKRLLGSELLPKSRLHFVLCVGVDVVGYGDVVLPEFTIDKIIIDEKAKKRGYEELLREKITRWIAKE